MSFSIDSTEAQAEIHFQHEWNLPSAGTNNPLRFWAHVHFEDDQKWPQERWTLFVELEEPPEPQRKIYRVRIAFMAPNAPNDFLKSGHRFDLCIGNVVNASGVVI